MALVQPGMREVQCKQCLAMTTVPDGTDPHSLTWCGCCAVTGEDGQPHHHGEAAAACSPDQHGGQPCWNPPAVPKPDGCKVCRPVIHFATAGARLA
jgi:hypothetical protein